MANGFSLTYTK